ncbi:hypothetical protein B0H11DRAFT_2289872 [Mycena galericulata]|nr:hypothetical protein B0H11DRAFT_2289872 [Mycena galericulata]
MHCFLGNIFVSSLVAPSSPSLALTRSDDITKYDAPCDFFVANSYSQLPPILSSTLTDTISIRPTLEDGCKTASRCRIPAILMRISANQVPASDARRETRITSGRAEFDENRKKQEATTAKRLATMQRNKQAREQPASAPPPAQQTPPLPRPGGLTTPLPPAPPSRQNVPQAPTTLPRLDLAGPGPFRRAPATPASLGPEPRRPLQLVNNGQTQYPDFSQYRPPVSTPQLPASQSPAPSLVSASSQSSLSSSSPDFRQDAQHHHLQQRAPASDHHQPPPPSVRPMPASDFGQYQRHPQHSPWPQSPAAKSPMELNFEEWFRGLSQQEQTLVLSIAQSTNGGGGEEDHDHGGDMGHDDEYNDDPWTQQVEDEPEDPLAASLADATSLLKGRVTMRTVDPAHVRRLEKRRRGRTGAASDVQPPVPESSPESPPDAPQSDSEEPPKKKKKKKNQASRSIKAIDVDLQSICEKAYLYLKIYLTHLLPWPRVAQANNQYEVLLLKAWHSACVELGFEDVAPDENCLKIIRLRVPQFRLDLKKVVEVHVPAAYGFKNIQTLAEPTTENIAKAIADNRKLVADLQKTFHYLNPNDSTQPNTMCRNPIFKIVLAAYWFGADTNNRASYFKGRTELEWETLSLIVVAVLNGIDQYKTGRFVRIKFEHQAYYPHYTKILAGLRAWDAWCKADASKNNTRNLAQELKEELLRDARLTAVVEVEEDGQDEEEEGGFFTAAMFAANSLPAAEEPGSVA